MSTSNWNYSGQTQPQQNLPFQPPPMPTGEYQPPYISSQGQSPQQLQPYQLPQYQPLPRQEKAKGGGLFKAFKGKVSTTANATTPPLTLTHASTSPVSQQTQVFQPYQPLSQQPATYTMPQWRHQPSSGLTQPMALPSLPPSLPPSLAIRQPIQQQQNPIYSPVPFQQAVAPLSVVSQTGPPAQQEQVPLNQEPVQSNNLLGSYRNSLNPQNSIPQLSDTPPPYSDPSKQTLQHPESFSSNAQQATQDEAILQPTQWPNEKEVPLSFPKPNPIPHAINNLTMATTSDLAVSQSEAIVGETGDFVWGSLFDESKTPPEPMPLLNEFLRGVGKYIISTWEKTQNLLISPYSMAMLYRSLAGRASTKFDFFISAETSPNLITAIYKKLGCQYFLIPRDSLSGAQNPTASPLTSTKNKKLLQPGLTLQGFETWMIIQIQLSPERECKRLEKLLKAENVKIFRDDGVSTFPSSIPRSAILGTPNSDIVSKFGGLLSPLKADSPVLLELVEADQDLNDIGNDPTLEELRKENESLKTQLTERDQEIKRLRQQLASIGTLDNNGPQAPAFDTSKEQTVGIPDPLIPGIDTPAPSPRPIALRSTSSPIHRYSIQGLVAAVPEIQAPYPPVLPLQIKTPVQQSPQISLHELRNKLRNRASTSFPVTTSGASSPNYRPYIPSQSVSPTTEKPNENWGDKAIKRSSLPMCVSDSGSLSPADTENISNTANRGTSRNALKRASMMLVDQSVRDRIEKKTELQKPSQHGFRRKDEFAKITGGW